MTRSIKITGELTDHDLQDLIALTRSIDARHPTTIIKIAITDPARNMDDGERLLREALPPLPFRATEFARAAYKDDTFPIRDCDWCGHPYRGPAVYCSIECAVADA